RVARARHAGGGDRRRLRASGPGALRRAHHGHHRNARVRHRGAALARALPARRRGRERRGRRGALGRGRGASVKKVLVLCALLGAMLLVDWLGPSQGSAAASLAGMGFVMLAAYAVAEIGTALSLPQVTGYILAGLALGPSIGGVISG